MIELGQLEANIVLHCNNRCVSCSHASPWHTPYYMEPAVLERDLNTLQPLIHARTFSLLGGEPLLHPKLVEMMWLVRFSHVADSLMVTTNGRLFEKMDDDFWKALQVLQVSVYPNAPDVLVFAECKQKEFGFTLYSRHYDEFKKQFGKRNTRAACSVRCPTVHDGKFYLCPQSLTFPDRFMGLPFGVDGFDLTNATEDALRQFIDHPPGMRACEICAGEQEAHPWREANNEQEWRQLSGL